jgi:RNA polymerase sigma factor (sigma-70 family)
MGKLGRGARFRVAAASIPVAEQGRDRGSDPDGRVLVETDLVTRAQAGDPDAFAELVEGHRRELELHCYRVLGSAQDAEDTVQETFLAAWQHIAGFQVRSSVRSWLYRIATNRCLGALRSARRRQPPEVTVPAGPYAEPNAASAVMWLEPYPDLLLEEIVVITTLLAGGAYVGPATARRAFAAIFAGDRSHRLIHTRANGQPAFGVYVRDPATGVLHASGMLVLTLAGDRIRAMTRFDNSVTARFGLPRRLP